VATTRTALLALAADLSVVPAIVLDPFGGAGTTALVASRLNRSAVLIDLSPEYCAMAAKRLRDDSPMTADLVGYV
jgi:DNA modification methylase